MENPFLVFSYSSIYKKEKTPVPYGLQLNGFLPLAQGLFLVIVGAMAEEALWVVWFRTKKTNFSPEWTGWCPSVDYPGHYNYQEAEERCALGNATDSTYLEYKAFARGVDPNVLSQELIEGVNPKFPPFLKRVECTWVGTETGQPSMAYYRAPCSKCGPNTPISGTSCYQCGTSIAEKHLPGR